ncbi:enoyl-CoA hydratase-related protein [Rhodobacter calidifons]|uniref:2-(1,2-epoxy-1,2-dihydrophenyl)acetyl-CoA isomerase n=1 Tax=Rhodobacter calidifons TaxID=2715277 RepID=A0ABX0G7X9_9RHOB|nr:enoyl-CoA hydratase-related protein [Rhodobacter calidifons]NHB77334.1 2-(1,2-epoxy-1,2-dihydrophenyl)acetyl-CoA isomerase [Rhodobacter calidifons]
MAERVRVESDGGVHRITLNRPEVMNALDGALRRALTEALLAGHGARVIVLTGAGRGFCSGQDLSDASGLDAAGFEATLNDEYVPMIRAIVEAPVPVIAAVNGVAAGAGANLALACDLVVACESAVFIQAFTRIGLIPDAGGTSFLPRRVGLQRAMGAALLAEPVSARQAEAWGMIWEAVPDDRFAEVVAARAARLAAGPTGAYAALKQAMRGAFDQSLEAQLAVEARLQAVCGASDDFREGVAAFQEKRAPRFTGA